MHHAWLLAIPLSSVLHVVATRDSYIHTFTNSAKLECNYKIKITTCRPEEKHMLYSFAPHYCLSLSLSYSLSIFFSLSFSLLPPSSCPSSLSLSHSVLSASVSRFSYKTVPSDTVHNSPWNILQYMAVLASWPATLTHANSASIMACNTDTC